MANGSVTSAATANDGAIFNILDPLETAIGADLVGTTVLRMIGWLQHRGPAPGFFDIGVLVTNGRAQAADFSAYAPTQNPFLDWLYYRRIAAVSGTTPDGFNGSYSAGAHVDVRGRRKLDEVGQELLLVWQQPTAVAQGFDFHLRILVALP